MNRPVFLLILIVVLLAAAGLAGRYYADNPVVTKAAPATARPAPVAEVAEAPAAASAHHLTVADLHKLGCQVDPALAKQQVMDLPLGGSMEVYGFKSDTPCATLLMSLVRQFNEPPGPGDWAGVRAAARIWAEEQGYEAEFLEGRVGDYSELVVFKQNGEAKGFEYIIEEKQRLRSVRLVSDKITADESFEALLKSKA